MFLLGNHAHSRGGSINLTITDVFPTTNIEVNTPVAIRFSWAETDATGTVTVSSGSQSCTATLPVDSCVIFPEVVGLQTILVEYSGDSNYPTESTSTDITTIERSIPQVVVFSDGSAPPWYNASNDRSSVGDMSSNGRFVVFESNASNLVANDNNGFRDIFIFDANMGTTELVSVSDDEMPLNGSSFSPTVSDNGRFIAFASRADNAVSDDLFPDNQDIFIRDRVLGTTTLVSRSTTVAGVSQQANGASFNPSISWTGERVAFTSLASNLDPLDTSSTSDIYVYDQFTQTLTLASVNAAGVKGDRGSFRPIISGDSQHIAFESNATNLVANDQNGNGKDVFVKNLLDDSVTLVNVLDDGMSIIQSAGSNLLDFSDDGQRVVFSHDDDRWFNNLEEVDAIFVRDIALSQTHLISQNNLNEIADDDSDTANISGNGELVYFFSEASNLDSAYPLPVMAEDVYVHDIDAGTTQLLNGTPLFYSDDNNSLGNLTVDNRGKFMAFDSRSTRLVPFDYNDQNDAFYWRQDDQNIQMMSQGPSTSTAGQVSDSSGSPSVNFTGEVLSFESTSNNLLVNDLNDARDAFVRDLNTQELLLINQANNGQLGNDRVDDVYMSDDGRFTIFESQARNLGWLVLAEGSDDNLYMFDRDDQQISPISININGDMGDGSSEHASITVDGRWVVFDSDSLDMVGDDNNGVNDIFIRDTVNNSTARLSNGMNGETNGRSDHPDITPDGRYVVFDSDASNIVANDTNDSKDVFLYDRELDVFSLISVDNNGVQANADSSQPRMSADGNTVVFLSKATNLDVADTNNRQDVYVRDLSTGQTTWASPAATVVNEDMSNARISHDGRYVSFETGSNNIVMDDQDGEQDVFVTDTNTFEVRLATVNAQGENSNDYTGDYDLSGNGRFIFFASEAANMVNNSVVSGRDILKGHNPFLINAPVPASDNFTIDEDQMLIIDDQNTTTMSLLDNDSDPNDDPLSVSSPLGAFQIEGLGGQVVLNSNGSFTYTPPTDQFGMAHFSYIVSDGNNEVQSLVTIDVTAANDPPSFSNLGDIMVDEDSGSYSQTWASDFSVGPDDESAQMLSSTTQVITTSGDLGFIQAPTIDAMGVLTFEAAADTVGQSTIAYTLSDDGGDDDSTTVMFTITVTEVNDAPSFNGAGNIIVDEDSGLYQVIWATDISAGPISEASQMLSSTTVIDDTTGNLSFVQAPNIDDNGLLTFETNPDTFGEAVITYTLMDDGTTNNTISSSFTITVNSVNDAPTFDNDGDVTVNQDSGLYQQQWASNFSVGPADESAQMLTFNTQIVAVSGNLSFSQFPRVSETGVLSFIPSIGTTGQAEIKFTIMDDGGGETDSSSATFIIGVLDVIFANGFE